MEPLHVILFFLRPPSAMRLCCEACLNDFEASNLLKTFYPYQGEQIMTQLSFLGERIL